MFCQQGLRLNHHDSKTSKPCCVLASLALFWSTFKINEKIPSQIFRFPDFCPAGSEYRHAADPFWNLIKLPLFNGQNDWKKQRRGTVVRHRSCVHAFMWLHWLQTSFLCSLLYFFQSFGSEKALSVFHFLYSNKQFSELFQPKHFWCHGDLVNTC